MAEYNFEQTHYLHGSSSSEYAIVQVPKGIPVVLMYDKPVLGISLDLTPDTELYWSVKGTVDADTFANLRLPVSEPRDGNLPPIVTDRDIQKAQERFGKIEQDTENPGLFTVDLQVPVNNIYHFLDAVFQPRDRELRNAWQLTEVGKSYMEIPTKRTSKVTLTVKSQVEG